MEMPVVCVTVFEHCFAVFDTILSRPVVVVFKSHLNCTEVHRVLDHLVVVRQAKFDGIYRFKEWPGKMVVHYSFQDNIFEVF